MNCLIRFAGVSAVLLTSGCLQQPAGQAYAQGVQQAVPAQQLPASAQLPATTAGVATTDNLVNTLTGQLGISQPQALGGLGSIFSLAQQRLNPGDFSSLSNSVPGIGQYLAAAPQPVAPTQSSALLGVAGSLLGGQSSALNSIAALAGSFQSLGMNSSMTAQFIPVVLQYLQGQNGGAATSLLQRALY
jgi:hypothetical protein